MTNQRSTPIDQIRAMRHRLSAERLDQPRYGPDDTQEIRLSKPQGPRPSRVAFGLLAAAAVGVTAILAGPAAATSEADAMAETASTSSLSGPDDRDEAISGDEDIRHNPREAATPSGNRISEPAPVGTADATHDAEQGMPPSAHDKPRAPRADHAEPDGSKPDGSKPDGSKPDGPKADGPKKERPGPHRGLKGKAVPGVKGPRADQPAPPAPPTHPTPGGRGGPSTDN